jgi:hypothetical protein
MKKPQKMPPVVIAGGVAFTIYLLNYAAVQLGFAPFAYCVGKSVASAFAGLWQMVTLVVMIYVVIKLIRNGLEGGLLAVIIALAVFGLPLYLTTAFGLGAEGRCG